MPSNRFSRLPVAEFCGRSGELDNGSGRAAAMSTYFHAHCEGDFAKYSRLGAMLTQAERDEVRAWYKPTGVTFDDGQTISYDDASKELPVGLDARGRFCLDPDKALVMGTLDMAWVRSDIDATPPDQTVNFESVGRVVAYVGDIKKTRWTTLDGPESLQLIGYAFAFAAKVGATHFCCGIWNATEGEWSWGRLIDLESPEAVELWGRIVHAAGNQGGEFRTGGHCSSCWSRMRCPAYLVPVEETHALAVLNGSEVTPDRVLKLLRAYERGRDTLEVVKDFLHEYARRQAVPNEEGTKRYMAVECKGKESASVKAVLEAMPDARERGVVKRGAPYEQMRWIKT